mmetsp:Transcript_58651/g.155100  ORF Transcript_58651/g.155100 Transcript_58651/m.155100 type:complete len:131 (-) Transcript_58651:39-431(-)
MSRPMSIAALAAALVLQAPPPLPHTAAVLPAARISVSQITIGSSSSEDKRWISAKPTSAPWSTFRSASTSFSRMLVIEAVVVASGDVDGLETRRQKKNVSASTGPGQGICSSHLPPPASSGSLVSAKENS